MSDGKTIGKLAVITGASRGIGAGLARAFARRGMRLALCARTEPVIPEGMKQQALSASVDVTDAEAVMAFARQAQETLGPIHLWINNAGLLAPIGMARSLDAKAFATLMNVNVLGVFHGTRAALALFAQSGTEGTIVNISSGASRSAYAGWSAYCASKAAVDQFTRVVALEEAAAGRRIYSLAPGVIETGMQDLIREQAAADFPAVDRFRGLKADGLLGDPEGPADVILKLAFAERRNFTDPCLDIKVLRDDPTF